MSSFEFFAVAGRPVLHSLSPALFRAAFAATGRNAAYARLSAVTAVDVLKLARHLRLTGLNVTSPFKQDLAGLLDELAPSAARLGAVNLVEFREGRVVGHNLDGDGVAALLERAAFQAKGRRAAVLGAGGAARAAADRLREEGAEVILINRTEVRGRAAAAAAGVEFVPLEAARPVLARADILLVCWPSSAPALPAGWLPSGGVLLDANYAGSAWAEAATVAGCRYLDGKEWLLGQAVSGYRILAGGEAPREKMRQALASPVTPAGPLVLAGIMGSGKSTTGRRLGARLSRPFVDTDREIEKSAGMKIPEIFAREGEEGFRRREREAVAAALRGGESVIALGGGGLLHPATRADLRGATVVWLWSEPSRAAARCRGEGRPLLAGSEPTALLSGILEKRFETYARSADLIVDADGAPPEILAERIADEVR